MLINHEKPDEIHHSINSDVRHTSYQQYSNIVQNPHDQYKRNEYENNKKSICKYNLQKRCIFGQNKCRNLHVSPVNEKTVRTEYETRSRTQQL